MGNKTRQQFQRKYERKEKKVALGKCNLIANKSSNERLHGGNNKKLPVECHET